MHSDHSLARERVKRCVGALVMGPSDKFRLFRYEERLVCLFHLHQTVIREQRHHRRDLQTSKQWSHLSLKEGAKTMVCDIPMR